MAIATTSFASVFMPIHSFVEWLGGGAAPNRHLHALQDAQPRSLGLRARPSCARRPTPTGQFNPKAPTLRVIRFVEPNVETPVRAGRMVICGRMADVCAEIDRLAALESRH